MNRQVFTLKYRPQSFAELLFQDHVRDTLIRAIESNRLANAYLFAGPRGVGKTTTARILSKCLNCLSYERPTITPCNTCSVCREIAESRSMDVLEIDGASNRGIDQVRELRESIKYAPTHCRYKVYIIDEVHMLTTEAFNALLKTLEEPPPHAKFIFATTTVHKVPLTIISRCQRFDFRKATPAEIVQRLTWIAKKEDIKISPQALTAIARFAQGAIRDAEGLLDQLATYSPEGIELSHVEELLGLVPARIFFEYAELVADGNAKGLIELVDRLFAGGYDIVEFLTGAIAHFRTLLLLKLENQSREVGLSSEELAQLKKQAERFEVKRLLKILSTLSKNEAAAKYSLLPRVLLELVSLELIEEIASDLRPRNDKRAPEEITPSPRPHNDKIEAGNNRRGDLTASELWLCLKNGLTAQKSVVASIMDFAKPVSWEGNTFTVAFAQEHKGLILQLEKKRRLIESILSEIAGCNVKFNAVVETKVTPPHIKESNQRPESDPIMEKLQEYLGDIEEC